MTYAVKILYVFQFFSQWKFFSFQNFMKGWQNFIQTTEERLEHDIEGPKFVKLLGKVA